MHQCLFIHHFMRVWHTNFEAMHEGCPTLASDIPVFKEILGQNGNYFNPRSHDDLIFNMEEIS